MAELRHEVRTEIRRLDTSIADLRASTNTAIADLRATTTRTIVGGVAVNVLAVLGAAGLA
jgi:hypothetical protein